MNEKIHTEIEAMSTISTALSELDQDAVRRVLQWANQLFQVKTPIAITPTADSPEPLVPAENQYAGIPELFNAANPTTGLERVLVVAYWFQIQEGVDDWDSFQINKELKHLGYPSGNITRDLDTLMARSPRLVIQVRKEGKTQQARKRYKLTIEGVKTVRNMVNANQ